jgi:predicted enzyme related to lactoylglutathione lyase
MTTGIRRTGEFCWVNMLTADLDAARDFYAALLGWTYRDMGGMGYGIKVGGLDVGAMFDLAHPNTPPGTRAHIGVMIKVDDADATCERITALGGKARAPFTVNKGLRMSVCGDSTGASFDVWESAMAKGMEVDSHAHGAPSWFEARTTDVPRAAAFYGEVFGWSAVESTAGEGPYTRFLLDDREVGGMMAITPDTGDTRPQWSTNFAVDDADEAARVATSMGATVAAVRPLPGIGRYVDIVSPQGVEFTIVEYLAR